MLCKLGLVTVGHEKTIAATLFDQFGDLIVDGLNCVGSLVRSTD